MSRPPVRFAASHKFLRKEALTEFPAFLPGLEPREECGKFCECLFSQKFV